MAEELVSADTEREKPRFEEAPPLGIDESQILHRVDPELEALRVAGGDHPLLEVLQLPDRPRNRAIRVGHVPLHHLAAVPSAVVR